MNWFFESNSASARVLRTIVQGVIGAVISYLLVIATTMPDIWGLLIIPVIMAILSPIMAEIGKRMEDDPKVGGSE